jgi:hypothetical protein
MQLYDTKPLRAAPMYAGKSSAEDQVQVLILPGVFLTCRSFSVRR